MIRKLVVALVLVPLGIVLVMFAVANRQVVTISFDPFGAAEPAFSLAAPLFVLIFVLVILGVIVGGAAAWLRQAKWRRAARLLESDMHRLRREIETLNERLDTAPIAPAPEDAVRISYRPPAA